MTGAGILLLSLVAIPASARQAFRNHVPAEVAQSRLMGPLSRTSRISLAIGLPLRNAEELDQFIAEVSEPKSPLYRQYVTSEEFTRRFAPSVQDYEGLKRFFTESGLTVSGTHPNRTILDVTGSVPAIERVFHVNMMAWQHPERGTFFSPDQEPSVDSEIPILDVSGLDNYVKPRPMNVQSAPLSAAHPYAGSGPTGLLLGSDFRAAYAPGVTLTGAGQTIALFELDGFYASDVQANFQAAGIAPVPVQTVLLDGFNGAPGGANIEVTLDIMMAAYMAPGASKILVYEGSNWNDILNRMAADNLARQISCSWGFSPLNATAEQSLKQMIAQGQSFLQASGDNGAYHGWIMPPSDDPNVTVVGGTGLNTTGPSGQYVSESAWGGSGGGVSTTYSIPSYQQSMNMAALGGSTTMRNIPDVAMAAAVQLYLICNNGQAVSVGGTSAAAPLWAGFVALVNQQAAASGKPAVGFLNPAIYSLGAGSTYQNDLHDIVSGSNGYSAIPGFDLATGWGSPSGQHLINDLAALPTQPSFTLSASPSVSLLQGSTAINTISITPQGGFTGSVLFSVSGLPAGVTGSFGQAATGGSSVLTLAATSSAQTGQTRVTVSGISGSLTGTASFLLNVNAPPSFTVSSSVPAITLLQAAKQTAIVTLHSLGTFTGKVNLTASGLPSGITAAFSPASTSTTSTLTLTAASTAAVGSATVTITATSGSLVNSASLALTVTAPPSFTLTASPASLNAVQGTTTASTLTVGPQNGFSGKVNLSISGLAAGVTASFSPVSTATTSTLTLTASSTAVAGTSTLTLTGVSGTVTAKVALNLSVTAPPDFSLSPASTALTVLQGVSGTTFVAVNPLNGFSGSPSFTVSGLPNGVTALFTPVSANGGALLTLGVLGSVPAGKSTVTVKAASGSIVHSANLSLNIAAPTANSVPVNLTSAYNVSGIAIDYTPFTSGGLDAGGRSYSGALLGASQISSTAAYAIGPMNLPDAVSGSSVSLPPGQYSALKFLGTGMNGNQPSQKFNVTYSDGTQVTSTQNLSDWFTPQGYAGESIMTPMAYRDNSTGTRDGRQFFLYQYSLPLNPAKTVASITLPATRNVVVLAMTLVGSASATSHVGR